ncbi:phage antirepressor [Corynebacterium bouchesdurhonense]|uniref:phage antirepressor n=1 Tax=Corynebacterium bouchesdurhonense TaxID=1720192 RepID=UPI0008299623|nr:phage antirepressor KilAC domain-containing protein [Corynebacterium bouchesdurhonense]
MQQEANVEITPFDFNGTNVRVVGDADTPMFVLNDVANVLGIRNIGNVVNRLDKADIRRMDVRSGGQVRNMVTVNESALYEVVLRSDKPQAREFSRWVTHEVLPSIRRHGGYLTEQKIEDVLADPDTIIKLATDLKAERARRAELEAQQREDAPKVLFANAVATSKSEILVGDLAKILKGNGIDIGANRLFSWMRTSGFLINRKGTDWNMPTQRAMELGLFRVKETAITHSDGHVTVNKTPKVTGKGQQYFIERFLDGRFNPKTAA